MRQILNFVINIDKKQSPREGREEFFGAPPDDLDKDCAWIFPLLADTDAKIKVQIFVLKKDTADIITAWAQDKAELLGIASLTQTHIEKLSGDNTI